MNCSGARGEVDQEPSGGCWEETVQAGTVEGVFTESGHNGGLISLGICGWGLEVGGSIEGSYTPCMGGGIITVEFVEGAPYPPSSSYPLAHEVLSSSSFSSLENMLDMRSPMTVSIPSNRFCKSVGGHSAVQIPD